MRRRGKKFLEENPGTEVIPGKKSGRKPKIDRSNETPGDKE